MAVVKKEYSSYVIYQNVKKKTETILEVSLLIKTLSIYLYYIFLRPLQKKEPKLSSFF